MTDADVVLEVRDLKKSFGGLRAVESASFDVDTASITSLIGPNGAGKTTAFNCIAGFYRADGGTVTFRGRRIDRLASHRVARAGLVRTFQHARALVRMSVLDNLLLAAPSQPGERLWRAFLTPRRVRLRERQVRARARELLEVVQLERHSDAYAGSLSGGQRKLLEFARALMAEPAMILLDEPMAGVNPSLGAQLLEHMRRVRAERGVTFLMVEHDLGAVMSVSDRVLVMSEGRVIAEGRPEQISRDQAVIDAYLGTEIEEGPVPA
ncbi:MAG: ABC transporter ATP-binding protein [Solirubrobacteraceae bacterium]